MTPKDNGKVFFNSYGVGGISCLTLEIEELVADKINTIL